jgi:hypothetical protein
MSREILRVVAGACGKRLDLPVSGWQQDTRIYGGVGRVWMIGRRSGGDPDDGYRRFRTQGNPGKILDIVENEAKQQGLISPDEAEKMALSIARSKLGPSASGKKVQEFARKNVQVDRRNRQVAVTFRGFTTIEDL